MNRFVLLGIVLLTAASPLFAARSTSDLLPLERRRIVVERAEELAAIPELSPLPEGYVQPFAPADFDRVDSEEARTSGPGAAAQAQARPGTDRELLNLIASKISPSGTLILGDQSLLIFGKKRLRVGDRLTVTYEEQDYTLDLVAIDRTTFTLRYNQDEITRPILKTGKTHE
ncbi:MAG: hypothetical protein NVV63_01515 [Opitutus sp.]|nr:hypothetical protein [Opitutus sp.]